VLIHILRMNNFNETIFVINQNCKCGRSLKVKINVFFFVMVITHELLHLLVRQIKYSIVKDRGHNYKFYVNRYFLGEAFNMAMIRNVEVMLIYIRNLCV
jgi:predicted SprT family Zn-dependent metalloprotease